MTSFYALDFGNFKTLTACRDTQTKKSTIVEIPGLTEQYQYGERRYPIVQSAIRYLTPDEFSIGFDACEIDHKRLIHSQSLKSNVRYNSSFPINSGDHVHHRQAAADYLRTVVQKLRDTYNLSHGETVGLAVSPQFANNFRGFHLEGVQLIVEQAAAVLATLGRLPESGIYMIVDFGAHTAHFSVVQFNKFTGFDNDGYCKLLASHSLTEPNSDQEIGGYRITEWLFQYFQQKPESSPHIRDEHWPYICKLKETLSFKKKLAPKIQNATGPSLELRITRDEFDELLQARGLYASSDQAINKLFQKMIDDGFADPARDLKGVIVVGGSALIPAFRRHLVSIFGDRNVHLHNAVDGIACGAAQLLALSAAQKSNSQRTSVIPAEPDPSNAILPDPATVDPKDQSLQEQIPIVPEPVRKPELLKKTSPSELPITPVATFAERARHEDKITKLKSRIGLLAFLLFGAFSFGCYEAYFKFFHMPNLIREYNAAIRDANERTRKENERIRSQRKAAVALVKQATEEQNRAAQEVLRIELRRQEFGRKQMRLRELERWLHKNTDNYYDQTVMQLCAEKQREIDQLKAEGIHDP